MQNWALGTEGCGNASDSVGASGSSRGDHAAEFAGLPGIAIGRMRGNLLVPHVNDPNAFVDAAVIDVYDVPAAQRKDRVDALILERFGHQMTAGDHARIGAFA